MEQSCCLCLLLVIGCDVLLYCQVHRLVIVDEDRRIQGILSLSDLLHFIILKPSSTFGC